MVDLHYGKLVPHFLLFPTVSALFLMRSTKLKRMGERAFAPGFKTSIFNVEMEPHLNFLFWLSLRLDSKSKLAMDLQAKRQRQWSTSLPEPLNRMYSRMTSSQSGIVLKRAVVFLCLALRTAANQGKLYSLCKLSYVQGWYFYQLLL